MPVSGQSESEVEDSHRDAPANDPRGDPPAKSTKPPPEPPAGSGGASKSQESAVRVQSVVSVSLGLRSQL